MRIFKMKGFARFTRREHIADTSLKEAIGRAESGNIDADLGGGLIKQRVARQGQGRSGGYRMVIAYRTGDRAIFLLGFAKNEQENISSGELTALRALVKVWLQAPQHDIATALNEGVLQEIKDDKVDETD
jgi:hypothetical protein